MNCELRLELLAELYRIQEQFCTSLEVACRKGCAVCCTENITMTTLEGLHLMEELERKYPPGWPQWSRSLSGRTPSMARPTLNQLARIALSGGDMEEEAIGESPGVCPFLRQENCPVYKARPLACRAMLSRTVCHPGGIAEMPEEVLTLNTVVMQYIEAIDRPGLTGNYIDILLFLSDDGNRHAYRSGRITTAPSGMELNQPIPALMVPPEQREKVQPVIDVVQSLIRGFAR
jgi:Fe-S-cluster containining protein